MSYWRFWEQMARNRGAESAAARHWRIEMNGYYIAYLVYAGMRALTG